MAGSTPTGHTPRADASAFVERVARLTRTGDRVNDEPEFRHTFDDAVATLDSLIHEARNLVTVGLPEVERELVERGLRLLFATDADGFHFPKYAEVRDNDGETLDRYSVILTRGSRWMNEGEIEIICMNAAPFWPQGIGMHTSVKVSTAPRSWRHLGKRIPFYDLPEDCQVLTMTDYMQAWRIPFEILQAANLRGDLRRRTTGIAAAALKSVDYWVGDARLTEGWLKSTRIGITKRHPDGR